MVEFLSSNFVGWLTLKANFAPKKKRSTKSKVSIFFPMKNRYIFWFKICHEHEAQISKFMVEEVVVRNRQYWNILFLSLCKWTIFGHQFLKKYYVWYVAIKIYEVWEVKLPLNTNFDEKIVLWEPVTICQSIKRPCTMKKFDF